MRYFNLTISYTHEVVTIDTLYNTGVDASGNVLSPGSTDPHWTLSGPGVTGTVSATVQSANSAWDLKNDAVGGPGSSWISIVASGNTAISPGNYTATTTFDLAGHDINTVVIDMIFASDNRVVSYTLNNGTTVDVSDPAIGFNSFSDTFVLSSGFNPGVNTLEVVWRNTGDSNTPGGFRAELSGVSGLAPIPEPSAFGASLLALAVIALTVCRRSRQSIVK